MAYDMQALQDVYLPKRMTEDELTEDYDANIAQNENALNQNLSTLYNKLLDLEDRLRIKEEE